MLEILFIISKFPLRTLHYAFHILHVPDYKWYAYTTTLQPQW